MTDLRIHEALVAAKDLIAREGWEQSPAGMHRGYGPHCVMSALWVVVGGAKTRRYYEAAEVLASLGYQAQTLAGPTGGPGAVGQWNDSPQRSESEILAALDHAISATAPALETTPERELVPA